MIPILKTINVGMDPTFLNKINNWCAKRCISSLFLGLTALLALKRGTLKMKDYKLIT